MIGTLELLNSKLVGICLGLQVRKKLYSSNWLMDFSWIRHRRQHARRFDLNLARANVSSRSHRKRSTKLPLEMAFLMLTCVTFA